MKRFAEQNLFDWYQRKNRKPLVIRGARQVGKSTLVRNFASTQSIKLHEINLERNIDLKPIFEQMSPERIIEEVQFRLQTKIEPGDILFFDEIQAIPAAIAALRYFYEEKSAIAVLAAGSLLELTLSQIKYSMPVGRVEFLYLGAMTFSESCAALGHNDLVELLDTFTIDSFPMAAHKRLVQLQRNYILVGGMPEAVAAFEASGDIFEAQRTHRSIAETYRNDFGKYSSPAEHARLHTIFDRLPTLLGQKIKYSNLDPQQQSREMKAALELLVLSQLIMKVHHSNGTAIPLRAGINQKVFKTYLVDCGLASTLSGIRNISVEDLTSASFFKQGELAEQFIAQHLHYLDSPLVKPESFYWLREGRQGNAEVDFLLQRNTDIFPIEVKAGSSGSLKSLQQFVSSKGSLLAVRFDMNTPSLFDFVAASEQAQLISLPLYAVEQLDRILDTVAERA